MITKNAGNGLKSAKRIYASFGKTKNLKDRRIEKLGEVIVSRIGVIHNLSIWVIRQTMVNLGIKSIYGMKMQLWKFDTDFVEETTSRLAEYDDIVIDVSEFKFWKVK